MCVRSIYTNYQEQIQRKAHRSQGKAYIHGQKFWDTFVFLDVFQFTQVQPLPSADKQWWTRVSRIFFRVSTLYGVGGGRSARKFWKRCTVLRGNREITQKYEYCSTIPRTFFQDCLNPCVLKKSVFFTFSTLFRNFGDKYMITCNNNDLWNYFLNIASFHKAIPWLAISGPLP